MDDIKEFTAMLSVIVLAFAIIGGIVFAYSYYYEEHNHQHKLELRNCK